MFLNTLLWRFKRRFDLKQFLPDCSAHRPSPAHAVGASFVRLGNVADQSPSTAIPSFGMTWMKIGVRGNNDFSRALSRREQETGAMRLNLLAGHERGSR